MPVRELLERIDSRELSEWLAYARIEPLPDSWGEAGTIAAAIVNSNPFREGPAVRPADFIPAVAAEDDAPAQSLEDADRLLGRAGRFEG